MSSFTQVTDRATGRIRALDTRRQVALYSCAAAALAAGYHRWRSATNGRVPDASELLARGLHEASLFALDGVQPTTDLLPQIESATPSEPTDVYGFTVAQDCWICLDTAIRSALESYDAADSAWYLLEPSFQATSERLFGYTDVGSQQQEAAESQALIDEQLHAAIEAVGKAIDLAAHQPLTRETLTHITTTLQPIQPI